MRGRTGPGLGRAGLPALALLAGLLALPGTASAAAPGPTVAVTAPERATLLAGGQVRVRPWVRCARDAQVYELYVRVAQPGRAASSYAAAAFTCDGTWHRVLARLTPTSGRLRPGPATIEALLLVETPGGTPAGARDTTAGTLVRAA